MFRRVRDVLSLRSSQGTQDAVVRPYWSSLPVEMKLEVMKYTSFPDRMRLRRCSRMDRDIVDSTPGHIPVLVFKSKGTTITVIFVHSPDNVARIDISKKRILRLTTRTLIQKSENLNGDNSTERFSRADYSVHLKKLFVSTSQRNVSVGTVNIRMEHKTKTPEEHFHLFTDLVEDFFEAIRRNGMSKPRIVFSGNEVYGTPLQYLGVDEVKISCSLARASKPKVLVSHSYPKCSMGAHVEFMHSEELDFDLTSAINRALRDSDPTVLHFYIPKLIEEDLEKVCQVYSEELIRKPNFAFLWLSQNDILVKISKCGVVIQKCSAPSFKIVNVDRDPCGQKWLCSNCDKTLESWYFRQFFGLE